MDSDQREEYTENFPMKDQIIAKEQQHIDDCKSDDGAFDSNDYIRHTAVMRHAVSFFHLLGLSFQHQSSYMLGDGNPEAVAIAWLFLLCKLRIDPTIARSLRVHE